MSVHDSAWTGKPGHWAHREPRDSNIREAQAYSLIKGYWSLWEAQGMKPSHTS